MRAAVSIPTEPWLVVEEVPEPTPEPGDLILRVDACGICGSDLHMAHSMKDTPGIVFGHEFCGTVVDMGAEVAGYREGDRVVGFPLVGCGRCAACVSGFVGKCRNARLTGAQRPGAYAEYVAVGAAGSFPLPEQLSGDLGALVEPLAVAHHALEYMTRGPGEAVLVLGAGPVGLAVALWAQALGASDDVVSDPVVERRALAEKIGAQVIDPTHHDVGAAFADMTGRRPRAVVECVGRPGLIQHATEVAGRDAHVTLVGACTTPDTFQPLVATSKELTLRFVVYYQRRDFAQTLTAMTSGRIDPSPLVTASIGLDDLPARFAGLMAPNADCKVLIHP
jgi:(R,R)-butanediol dehydrogenase/meso-butanediol dehydrogenase/diacetyl reductase